MGAGSAHIAVVTYSDFQCPYCGKAAREILPVLIKGVRRQRAREDRLQESPAAHPSVGDGRCESSRVRRAAAAVLADARSLVQGARAALGEAETNAIVMAD